jgi:tRNA-dihydrouridine synthase B
MTEFSDVMLRHLSKIHAFYGEKTGTLIARKHLGWYCGNLPFGGQLRSDLMRATSRSQQMDLVSLYFEENSGVDTRLAA